MFQPETRHQIEQELARGEESRRQGLEGRARVCARRAAGVAARAYLEGRGLAAPGQTSVSLLDSLQSVPEFSQQARQAAEFLLTRVNESYELPMDIDLLEVARQLVQELDAGTG